MSNPRFSKEYSLRTSDFDRNGHLHPQSILDLFQDVAGLHAELLGIGRDVFIKRNIIWVLVRTKYTVIKEPSVYDTVVVRTWPLVPGKVVCQRDYLIEDTKGNILVRGTSDWVLMDINTKAMVKSDIMYPYDENEKMERALDTRLRKIHFRDGHDFSGSEGHYKVTPAFSDIDVNGHVNNTKYAMYIENALNGAPIETMQIDYLCEVLPGENLDLSVFENEEGLFVRGRCDDSDTANFMAKITLKEEN